MPPQALAAVATLLAILPHGNRIELELNRGSAELRQRRSAPAAPVGPRIRAERDGRPRRVDVTMSPGG